MPENVKELKEKVELYEYILNNSSCIMYLNSNKGRKMIWSNKRHEDFIGITTDEVNKIGLQGYVKKFLHPDEHDIYANSLEHLSNKDLDQSLSIYRQKDRHGNWRKILVSGKVSKWDENNLPEEVVGSCIDVTDKFAEFTRFEELLKENVFLKNKLKLKDLTNRETQILKQISKGLSTKEIAESDNISFNTVEWHRKNISKKLRINKVSELVRFAVECGL